MKLLVIRHGIAGDAEEFAATGRSDDERPLTEKGKREMARVAAGLSAIVEEVDAIAPSPLVRARQTAEIVAGAYGMKISEPVDALRPTNAPSDVTAWARSVASLNTVAIVGHDPHLSRLVTWMISGVDAEGVALKKGGACLIEFDETVEAGAGALRWLMTPAQIIACEALRG